MSINPNNFLLDIPQLHPATNNYVKLWKKIVRHCIEGMWQGGVWMPGRLFFYGNISTMELSSGRSKNRVMGRPRIRDIEWEVFRLWEEARGFSGFIDDHEYTCFRIDELLEFHDEDQIKAMYPNLATPSGSLKKFVPARDYMKMVFERPMGRPLYENEAQNFLAVGGRGWGKSYMIANLIAHEFLFDGAEYYGQAGDKPIKTNSIVGAGDSKFSNNTLAKTKMTFESLPGHIEIDGLYYPSPIYKQTSGSLHPGKELIAQYDERQKGGWRKAGTKSAIKNRSFKDNPFAAQGERSGLIVLDEIGMFNNLRECYAAMVDVQKLEGTKFGSMFMTGTGGDMEGGGSLDAHYMFTHPHQFDLLSFYDTYEQMGQTCFFMPAYKTNSKFKDENGWTVNIEIGKEYYLNLRKKMAAGGSDSTVVDNDIIYQPLVPSEVFMVRKGNFFPVPELMARLQELISSDSNSVMEKRIELYFDSEAPSGVSYNIDVKGKLVPINEYPWTKQTREGCVVAYELPATDEDGKVPQGLYIIGHDPYASDDPNGGSHASIYVLKTKKYLTKYGHDDIVAQYVGRPFQGRKQVNEILYKLAKFYNAKIYFENVRGNTKEYFEKIKQLPLLATQPQTVLSTKASFVTGKASATYGYPMSNQKMKLEGIQYIRDWLLEPRTNPQGKVCRNLDFIYDTALVQELIQFNLDGNFDRVMGFMGCVIGMEETFNQYVEKVKIDTSKISFLTNNSNLFK